VNSVESEKKEGGKYALPVALSILRLALLGRGKKGGGGKKLLRPFHYFFFARRNPGLDRRAPAGREGITLLLRGINREVDVKGGKGGRVFIQLLTSPFSRVDRREVASGHLIFFPQRFFHGGGGRGNRPYSFVLSEQFLYAHTRGKGFCGHFTLTTRLESSIILGGRGERRGNHKSLHYPNNLKGGTAHLLDMSGGKEEKEEETNCFLTTCFIDRRETRGK